MFYLMVFFLIKNQLYTLSNILTLNRWRRLVLSDSETQPTPI